MKLDYKITQIINNIERITKYLGQRVNKEPAYNELIESLNVAVSNLEAASKPVVKIVSPSATLANNLQTKNQANRELRSLYEFQVVSPINNLREIVQNCDLICLIYFYKQNIIKQHQQLIRLAQQEKITLVLVVKQPDAKLQDSSLSNWLQRQNFTVVDQLQLPLNNLLDFNNEQHLQIYQEFLIQLSASTQESFLTRSKQKVAATIKSFIHQRITSIKQEIEYLQSIYLQELPPSSFEKKLRSTINQLNKEKQQIIKNIKLNINYSKSSLLNPFRADSLVTQVTQMIDDSKIKIVKETGKYYLYLILNKSLTAEYIHDQIIEICQQKTDDIINWQWLQINNVSEEGSLETLAAITHDKLNIINPLLTSSDKLSRLAFAGKCPSLDLEQIINYDYLKYNSRIVFDYHFTQSSWFRLLIFTLVGLGIYLFTWIFFGSGKYIGFIIVVFQIVNLITGQDIKATRLKQQSKELKRIITRNYQNLIRLVIEQSIQTLTIALEQESQLYDDQLENLTNTAYIKLDELKQTINIYKSRKNSLEEDRTKILSWLD